MMPRLVAIFALWASAPTWAADVTAAFSVIQSAGLDLQAGDTVRVRVSVNPGAEGVEGRGMANSPEIRYPGAVTAVSIQAGAHDLAFSRPLDVIVAPLRNQWAAGLADMQARAGPPAQSGAPQLDAMTMVLTYAPDALPLDTPVPPPGALTAEQSDAARLGIDLMVQGRMGDPPEAWTIVGRFQSMGDAR